MSNRVVDWFRGNNPSDTRSDDEITLDMAAQYPDTFQQYPDAMSDFDRIRKALLKAQATPMDYVKQGVGSVIRGAANTIAGVPEAIAINAKRLDQTVGPLMSLGEPEDKPVDEYLTGKLAKGIRAVGEKLSPEPVEGLEDSFWASTAPQAIGSAAGFMAGGAAGRVLKVPEVLGVAGLGAMSNGADAWKEAKASGASDEDAYKVFLLNAGVGTSEALPLGHMLKRLDGISKGSFTKFLIEAGKDTFEESAQEAAQQFAQNYIAQQYYDKDRDLLKDIATNAEAGGLTGFLFSAITQAIGHKIGKLKEPSKAETKLKDEAATLDSQVKAAEPPAVSPAVDVRQNFVTDEDKKAVDELVKLEQAGVTGPQLAAASTDVGERIKSAPALVNYYAAEQAKVSPKVAVSPASENASSSETNEPAPDLVQALLDEANQHFDRAQAASSEEATQANNQTDLNAAVAEATDAKGVTPTSENQEKGQGQELLTNAAPGTTNPQPIDNGLVVPPAPNPPAPAAPPAPAPTTVTSVTPTGWQKLTPASGIEDIMAKVVEQKASVSQGEGGQGRKDARIYEDTGDVEELYKDSRATGQNKTFSRKLAVLQSPDGSHVLIGTAYRNASSGTVNNMISAHDESRAVKPRRFDDLMAEGWKLVGAIKTDAPTKSYAATYSPTQWQTLRESLVGVRQAQAGTAAAMESQLHQAGFENREADKEAVAESAPESELAGKLEGLTNEEAAATTEATEPEREKIKGFGPEEGKAIFDALQGKTRDELTDPNAMKNAIIGSRRATAALKNLFRALGNIGAITEDAEAAFAIAHKLIYEATIQAGRNDFAESLLSGIRATSSPRTQEGGAGHTNAGAGGEGGSGGGGSEGVQAGAPVSGKAQAVADAASVTKTNPTEAEKKSGDYQKGVVTIDGLDVVIETPQGAKRSGKGWEVQMPVHYGYVKGTEGHDGDEVDVYIGEHPESPRVWIVDQIDPKTKKFDEHKALIGFDTKEDALAAYDAAFSDKSGPARRGAVTEMAKEDFVDWVNEGGGESGALAYGKRVRNSRKRSVSLEDELNAEMNAEQHGVIDGPGWITPDGSFVPADETSAVSMSGIDIGGHERAALAYLEQNRPDLYEKLTQKGMEAGVEDWSDANAIGLVRDFMLANGFIRMAGGRPNMWMEGKPNRSQMQLARDSAIMLGATLTHDNGGRSRVIYEPDVERFSSGNTPAERERDNAAQFNGLLESLHALGVDTRLITQRVGGIINEFGRFTQSSVKRQITLSLADVSHPSAGNFADLLEEALHTVYANETPERQAAMDRAIGKVSDALLGISGLRLSSEYSTEEAAAALQEERLVAAVGKSLMAEGFNPAESRGFAQAILRWMKDIYHRVTLSVMEASGLGASPEQVQAYFDNRVRAILSGDSQISVIDFLGGPKLGPLEAMTPLEVGELLVSKPATNERVRNSSRFVTNPREEPSRNLDSTELKKPQVAAQNFIGGVLEDAFKVFQQEGLNRVGLTLDQFSRKFVKLPEYIGQVLHYHPGEIPGDVIAETNRQLAAIGQPQVNPKLQLADVNEPMRKRAAAQAHRVLATVTANLTEQRRVIDRDAETKFKRLQRDNQERMELVRNYTDLGLAQSVAAGRVTELVDSLRKSVKTIGTEAHRAGILEQVLNGIGERLDPTNATEWVKATEAAANKLGSGGTKFGDMLEATARLDLDWDKATVTEIKALMFASGAKELAPLIESTQASRALLAAVIAFGKEHANTMDLLALRRESATEQRQAANEALSKAMEDHKDAVNAARALMRQKRLVNVETDADGKVIGVEPTRIGRRLLRILNRLELLKERSRKTLDEIEREGVFTQWHTAAQPMFRARLTELERMFGAQYQDWQLVDGATYPVPASKTAKLESVLANTATVDLTKPQAMRGDMIKLREWLDNVPEGDRGADWQDMETVYRKVSSADIVRGHTAAQQNFMQRYLAPLPDRLRFIGTPLTRLLGARIYNEQQLMRRYTEPAQSRGQEFEAERAKAMRALGYKGQDLDIFDAEVYQPICGWLEKHMDILAAAKTKEEAEAAGIKGVLDYLATDPATANKFDDPKARRSVEGYLRSVIKNSGWLAANGLEMGNKVLDEAGNYRVYRDPIGLPPFTLLRSFSAAGESVFNLMRDTLWATKKINRDALVEVYQADPAKAHDVMRAYSNKDIWTAFVQPWINRDGRSAFLAPATEDGLRRFASRENVIKAGEAAKGDLVTFAEVLHQLEGGKTDLGEFVGDTLAQWQSNYDIIEMNMRDPETSGASLMPQPGPRRFIADARASEELPREFMSYLPYDTFAMRQVTRGQVYQSVYGRNLEAWNQNVYRAKKEQSDLATAWEALKRHYRLEGLSGAKLRQAIKAEVEGGFKNVPGVPELAKRASFTALAESEANLKAITAADDSFRAGMSLNRTRPVEFRSWYALLGAATGLTVSGPATALTDNVAMVEQPFRKLGFDWEAVKFVLGIKKNELAIAGNSFLQALNVGWQSDSEHVRRLNDLGFIDDDATISAKDKMLAYFLGEHNLAATKGQRAVWSIGQAIRLFLTTGFGRAKSGTAAYPTFKPHSPFVWGSQVSMSASVLQFWQRYESLVGAAVAHFQANPDDLTNPDFKFSAKHVREAGFKTGLKQWEFLSTKLADYGLGGLEQVARDSVRRRQADSKAALLTRDDYTKLAVLAQNEITLDSGLATRAAFLKTDQRGAIINPLLGWAVQKSYDFTVGGFRDAEGRGGVVEAGRGVVNAITGKSLTLDQKKALEGTRTAMVAMLFGVLPSALAYALMRDLYDEYVMKKKSNVLDLRNIDSPGDLLATVLDNASRVGTAGIMGEKINQLWNFDSARPVSMDSRIFLVSSLVSMERALGAWYMQGSADYATVGRPLLSALGGSGYLQYADSINGALGLDNTESRIARRISVSNYLRAAGKELKLDVRKSMPGGAAMPTPLKPYVGRMVMAALANDSVAFNEAYRDAKQAAREMGNADPEDAIKRSFGGYNPLRTVFQTTPSEGEYRRMLGIMSDDGAAAVAEAMRNFNHYAGALGIRPGFGKEKPAPGAIGKPHNPISLGEIRRHAVESGY